MVQTIPVCGETSKAKIDEWLATNGASLENLTDVHLVAAVTQH